jgi:1-acyl-sn-glycerol-3-phosphate acyltransferase
LRLLSAIGVLFAALVVAPLMVVLSGRSRQSLVRWVFRSMLRALGATLEVHGDFGSGRGGLVVNNHVSWLDTVVMNAVRPMRSVAKLEIESWPVVGHLASHAGTVYLDRASLRALPGTVGELTAALRGGSLVNVAPEGTTWCGMASGRFRPALFQAALDASVPVCPVVVRYRLADGGTTTWPAFLGDESLIDSVRRTARLRGLVVEVRVLAEIAPGRAADRRELAMLAQHALTARVPEPRSADVRLDVHAGELSHI